MYSTSISIALSGGSNPSTYGSGVSWLATVTPTGGGIYPTMDGFVSFYANGVFIGSESISWDTNKGSAGIIISNILVGSSSITATYSGDGNYSTSNTNASPYALTVNKYSPSFVTLYASPSITVYGEQTTIIAEFGYAPGTCLSLSGIADFYDSGTPIGSASLVPGGGGESKASLILTSPSTGSHSLTATYLGNANYNSLSSSPGSLTVLKANTTVSLRSSANPAALCQQVSATAKVAAVSPGSGEPSGTVTFTINGTPGSPVTLVGGVATTSTSGLPTGSNSISAAYSGDGNFNTSSSSTLIQTVGGKVNWILNAAPLNSDPKQGKKSSVGAGNIVLLTGQLQRPAATVDSKVAGVCKCPCACNNDNNKAGNKLYLNYLAAALNIKPIVLATLATDYCSSVPSQIQAQLTWNSVAQATVTYSATGHNAGDVYALPLQVSTPVTTSGVYPWSVQAWTTVGTSV